MDILGLDVGGSGIKGALVDTEHGRFITDRHRVATPQPATPESVIAVATEIVQHFAWHGPIGCGFPAAVKHGVIHTAANIAPDWIGQPGQYLLQQAVGAPVWLLNDADAAGLAEMRFGAGREQTGLVLVVTLGTGIGTALFIDGQLVPNTELGHIEIRGKEAEKRASDAIRKRKNLDWAAWAERLDEYLETMNRLFWPDVIILGGGVSKHHEHYIPLLKVRTRVVPAELRNDAGIIGAAMAARHYLVTA
ncbi:MAG: ROK family protein [Chloroflexaceae bacterium]|nr:ROK family protein [Chloroflexaceae bacterium]